MRTGTAAVPVPERVTSWGDPPLELSATFIVAVRAPTTAGFSETEMVQLALGARVAAQVVVCVKEDASVPVKVIGLALKVSARPPVLVTVTTCAALVDPTGVLAKVRVFGVSEAVAGVVPTEALVLISKTVPPVEREPCAPPDCVVP